MSPLRDAASLILIKPDGNSWRILMGLRNANHKFLPNHMVFPGGGVDDEDYTAPAATELRADTFEQLTRAATPDLANALGGLHYLCRAETPADRPIRFNARFFVAAAALVTGELGGSGELESLDWYELEAILKLDLALATRVVLGQLQTWLTMDDHTRKTRKIPYLRDRAWGQE
jgi:8-oxo-dGTP pyrophosphatase MutT (NUDIX family)